MGKTKTGTARQTPGFAEEVQPVTDILTSLFQGQGAQKSPFYSDLQRMYQNTLGTQSFALPDYVTKTLESAATTGMPSNTPLAQTEFYKAVQPTFQNVIQGQVLPALKESFGAQGALRTGAYEEAAGKGVTSAIGDLIMNAAQQAYGLEEAAKNRQMTGAQAGITAAQAPYGTAAQAGTAATGIEASQYPLLAAMLSYAGLGAGQQGVSTQYTPNFSCCWTFLQGEGKITECVRRYRDEHFGKWSNVGLGYRWLSYKIVPLMKRFKTIQLLVKHLMTTPLSKYAEFCYKKNKYGFIFKPLVTTWECIWSGLGKLVVYRDSKIIATMR